MTPKQELIDQRLVRALAHPLRVRILDILAERVASPIAIAEQLKSPLTDVAYHTRALDRYGCLELVGTAQRRGATEHFYKAQPRSFIGDPSWREVPRPLRGAVSAAALQTFFEKAIAAVEAGTIDDEDASFCWTPLHVDTRGKDEIATILDDAAAMIVAVHERSRRRLTAKRRAGEGISTVLSLAHFETAGSRRGA